MPERIAKYDLYLNTPQLGQIKAASAALREEHGALNLFALRYDASYLDHSNAFALDPVQLPLTSKDIELPCHAGGMPGILDDYLPDAWGKKVLAQLAFYKQQRRISEQSPVDLLSLLGSSRIGALQWVAEGQTPKYELGAEFSRIAHAEAVAQAVEQESFQNESTDEHALAYLANAGTGVGGARPKALIHDGSKAYLAKFNSLTKDDFNHARVELACLNMAKAAGIQVFPGRIAEGINGREVLLLNRFDVLEGGRQHIITVNSLLKASDTQCDRGGAFRYDDIAKLVKKWSINPQGDLQQLLRQMLFNAAINNTDDHERNFSFVNAGEGYRLSPAYDMVPSIVMGQYHAAGYQYQPYPPQARKVNDRAFDLPAPEVKRIADQVANTVTRWPSFAEEVGVSLKDIKKLATVIRPSR